MTLLSALNLIKDQNSSIADKVVLVLVGDGEYRSRVQEQIEKKSLKNTQITGWVPYKDIPVYIQKKDVLYMVGYELDFVERDDESGFTFKKIDVNDDKQQVLN